MNNKPEDFPMYRVAQKSFKFFNTPYLLDPFKIKWNGFHQNVPRVSGEIHAIFNSSKDMVCWKMYNFFGPPSTVYQKSRDMRKLHC